MKFIRSNLCSLGMVIVILCTVLCGIVSADSERDTGSHGWPPAINQLTFPATINIKGQVLGGNDGNFNPSFVYSVSVYLEETPVSDPENPVNTDKVKLLATIQPDTNGKFSYQYQYIPEKWQFLRIRPVTIQKVALALIQSPSPNLIYQPDDPALTFDLAQIWYNSGSTPVDAGAEWRISPFTIANPLQKEGVQAHTELEINPAVSLGTKIWNCTTITEPGYYILEGNIKAPIDEYRCIQILSSDVVFDGNNKKIYTGTHDPNNFFQYSSGISVRKNNVTITNVDVSGWQVGIDFSDCSDGIIQDSNIHENRWLYHHYGENCDESQESGIWLSNTTNVQIINNSIKNNRLGVVVDRGHNNIIGGLPPCQPSSHQGFYIPGTSSLYDFNQIDSGNFRNEISGNEIGILLVHSNGNKVIHNALYGNGLDERDWSYFKTTWPIEKYGSPVYRLHPSGIDLKDSNDNDIKMNAVSSSRGDGLLLFNASDNRIFANGFDYNKNNGIHIDFDSSENTIQSNYIGGPFNRDNPTWYECDTTYNPCKLIQHFGSGLFIEHTSENNIIFNNYIVPYYITLIDNLILVNVDRDMVYPAPATIFTTPEKKPGPNIVGGPAIGGNYWGGTPGTPSDINNNGFADKAFCVFAREYCFDPQPGGPSIDHQPLVRAKNGLYLSTALTGDLCQNPPDATLKFSNQNLNQVRNQAGSITLSPTQTGGFKNIVRDQPSNQSVVSLVDRESITQPAQPTSLLTWLVSIPWTVMSFVQMSPATETHITGPVTIVDIQQKPVADGKEESMHIVVLPGSDDQRTETVLDSGRIVPLITPTLPEQPLKYTQVYMNESPEGSNVTPSPEPRISIPKTFIGYEPTMATYRPLPCPSGSVTCNGQCVDLMTDTAYCGSCNTICEAGFICSSGMCTPPCSSEQTRCNGACVNMLTDTANCGACGNVCTNGGTCGNGQCVLPMVKIQPTGIGGVVTIRQHL